MNRLLRWLNGENIDETLARQFQEQREARIRNPREYDIEPGGWGLLGNGRPNAAAWPCDTCGAVVVDRERHAEWHAAAR